tara:strand:- start:160 stop:645 length:486 start_codon:yes stop_codon:yes gene_type:complete
MHSLNTIKEQNKSNAKKLIDLTLKNGGVSFNNDLEPLTLKEGFAVGIKEILCANSNQEGTKYNHESCSDGCKIEHVPSVPTLENLEKTLNTLDPFNAHCIDEMGKGYNAFYGLWVESGWFYLDGCIQILDYQTAVNYGKHFKQQAIYDFKNEIEINLEGGK